MFSLRQSSHGKRAPLKGTCSPQASLNAPRSIESLVLGVGHQCAEEQREPWCGWAINAPRNKDSRGAGRLSMLRGTKTTAAGAGYQCSEEQREPWCGQAINTPKSKESRGARGRLSMRRGAKRAMVLGAGVNQCSEKQREPRGGNLR